jgi:GxxExxY protein
MRGIVYAREVTLPIYYKGKLLKSIYRADFICFNEVIVEVKALSRLSGTEEAQIIHYLKATGLQRGLLLNFGVPSLFQKRFVLNYQSPG